MRLVVRAECTVRNRELIVGMVISILLVLILLTIFVRKVPLKWVFSHFARADSDRDGVHHPDAKPETLIFTSGQPAHEQVSKH